MAKEIERKFLVDPANSSWRQGSPTMMRQGYLNTDKQRTVRIRVAGEQAYLTVKGITQGATRDEFEYEIPIGDAEAMLKICEQPLVEKQRFHYEFRGNTWEIDEFVGDNTGLIIAEIELDDESQIFDSPGWLGQEVTDDPRYYNANLVRRPLSQWDH